MGVKILLLFSQGAFSIALAFRWKRAFALLVPFPLLLFLTGCSVLPSFAQRGPEALEASGTIEALEVRVTSEIGGRLQSLEVEEGRRVEKGAVVARIDDTPIVYQLKQAEANLTVARLKYVQAKAGPRLEEIRQAQAAVEGAQAAVEAAERNLAIAKEAYDNPTSLEQQLEAARAQQATAQAQYQGAKDSLDQVTQLREEAEANLKQLQDLAKVGRATPQQVAEAQAKVDELKLRETGLKASLNQASAALAGAEKTVTLLEKAGRDRTQLRQGVVNAEAQLKTARANLTAAQARYDQLRKGVRLEDLQMLEAQVQSSQAVVDLLRYQQNKTVLTAPRSGVVHSINYQVGEFVAPGAPILSIIDLENLYLRVFIPEAEMGKVKIGQTVQVSVDAFPGKNFPGTVTEIASQTEYTPRNTQTKKERATLVLAVKISLPNPTGDLKPGLPADVHFPAP